MTITTFIEQIKEQLPETEAVFANELSAHIINLTANAPDGKLTVRTPRKDDIWEADIASFSEHRKSFSSDHGAMLIVLPDGTICLTAYAQRIERFLKTLGFEEKRFGSPIRGNEFPLRDSLSFEWARIKMWALKLRDEAFRKKCLIVAESKGVKPIAESVLARALLIPDEGLRTVYVDKDTCGPTVRPVLSITSSFEEIKSYVGTYGMNDGWVQFVTHDGRHYIVYGYDIIAVLEATGYTRSNLGGKPTDTGAILVAAFSGGIC